MTKIIKKEILGPGIKSIEIKAPFIAKKAKPGQFVILRIDKFGERFPLTISANSPPNGSIRLIFQELGKSTAKLGTLNTGDYIQDVAGPLGKPARIRKYGEVLVIGAGVGIAEVYPVIEALSKKGNLIVAVLGARNKKLLILKDEIRPYCKKLYITTDDGSYGIKGYVTDVLENILKKQKFDLAYVIGPTIVMKKTAGITKKYNVPTRACLSPVMVDGCGMCGSCRVEVGGRVKFACVDGPEFDAHKVNFDELISRLKLFEKQEHYVYKTR